MIADEYELPAAEHDGYHALGLGGLCALVDEHRLELELGEARITRAHARAAYDVGVAQQLALALAFERAVALLVRRGQLAGFVFELLEFLQLGFTS